MGYLNTVVKHLISIDSKLDTIIAQLVQLNATEVANMASAEELQAKIDEATAEVSQNSDVVASATTVMSTLSQQLKDALAAGVPDAAIAGVQAVIDNLDANTSALATAVAANTPAAP